MSEHNARLSGSLFTTNTAGLGIDFVRMTDKSKFLKKKKGGGGGGGERKSQL